jgi:hypothetical protein
MGLSSSYTKLLLAPPPYPIFSGLTLTHSSTHHITMQKSAGITTDILWIISRCQFNKMGIRRQGTCAQWSESKKPERICGWAFVLLEAH